MKAINTFNPLPKHHPKTVIAAAEDSPYAIYQDEPACVEAFRKYRVHEGVICKKCRSTEYYWLTAKEQFQCKKCRFRTTLRSGSILENCKLPFSYLFVTVHLLLKTGNKATPEKLQSITGHKYFEPLWYFIRKVKEEMSLSDQMLLLVFFIESLHSNDDHVTN